MQTGLRPVIVGDGEHDRHRLRLGIGTCGHDPLSGRSRRSRSCPRRYRASSKTRPAFNAIITIPADAAMQVAREAEAMVMRGDPLGPLHGVPVGGEGSCSNGGHPHDLGLADFKDHISVEDSIVVARLKRAGAIVVGKTTTPEFGQQCLTEAPLFGRTRNAWRADRTSGGSSGGSAVAVAAGLVPIAIATDGGGSTRIPAACNGVVGFKQGLGVVPQEYAQAGSAISPTPRR